MNKKLAAALILGFSTYVFAQFAGRAGQSVSGRGFDRRGVDPQTGGRCLVPGYRGTGEEDSTDPRKIDRNGFVYARVRYHTQPWRGDMREIPWHHDYPDGDTMFPAWLE